VLLAKWLFAPKAFAQRQMNDMWAAENPLYLPFRMQLVLKQVVYAFAFGYAFPVLYVITAIFFAISIHVDHSGLLRTFRQLVCTSDKMLNQAVTQVLPLALVVHCLLAVFFAHHAEMQRLGLINYGSSINGTADGLQHGLTDLREFRHTIDNGNVVLALVLFFLSLPLAVGFVIYEKKARTQQKLRRRELIASSKTLNSVGHIPFRELDKNGADPRLYLPPLTTSLLVNARNRRAPRAAHRRSEDFAAPAAPLSTETGDYTNVREVDHKV